MLEEKGALPGYHVTVHRYDLSYVDDKSTRVEACPFACYLRGSPNAVENEDMPHACVCVGFVLASKRNRPQATPALSTPSRLPRSSFSLLGSTAPFATASHLASSVTFPHPNCSSPESMQPLHRNLRSPSTAPSPADRDRVLLALALVCCFLLPSLLPRRWTEE
jgi:hypothetical protein